MTRRGHLWLVVTSVFLGLNLRAVIDHVAGVRSVGSVWWAVAGATALSLSIGHSLYKRSR